jgi:hypothetical protein
MNLKNHTVDLTLYHRRNMRKIKTTKIGQKDYVDVSERILHFWALNPNWSILTSIEEVNLETGVVIIKAWVEDEKGRVRSTGHAHEFQADKKSRVNMTSFVENCETSAIGRCLGTLGIGTEYGIASAFEVKLAKEKEAEMKALQLKNYQDKADEVDPPTGGEQKIPMEVGDSEPTSGLEVIKDIVEKVVKAGPTVEPEPEAETVAEASQEWKDQMTGKKKAPVPTNNDEKEEEWLVEFNRRVSTLKNAKDAKALANEGREWSDNWTYKKDTYKTMYACISESFAAFKRSEDNAESANLKGGT